MNTRLIVLNVFNFSVKYDKQCTSQQQKLYISFKLQYKVYFLKIEFPNNLLIIF